MRGGAAIRALIVDDQRLFAEAIRAKLESIGMSPVHVRTSGAEAVELAGSDPLDLVLLDIGLPGEDGIAVGRTLMSALPKAKVVALTGLKDAQVIRQTMEAGFHGFLTKDVHGTGFSDALRRVMAGEIVVPPKVERQAIRANGADGHTPEDEGLLANQLTRRELEVLELLVRGIDSAQVAEELGIRVNTVRTHVHSILSKLGVASRLEASAFAVRNGLVRLPWIA